MVHGTSHMIGRPLNWQYLESARFAPRIRRYHDGDVKSGLPLPQMIPLRRYSKTDCSENQIQAQYGVIVRLLDYAEYVIDNLRYTFSAGLRWTNTGLRFLNVEVTNGAMEVMSFIRQRDPSFSEFRLCVRFSLVGYYHHIILLKPTLLIIVT